MPTWSDLFILTLFISTNSLIGQEKLSRHARARIRPCLSCTFLNRNICCERHRRCCNGTVVTGTLRPVNNPQVPLPAETRNDKYPPVIRRGPKAVCPDTITIGGNGCAACNLGGTCSLNNSQCCPPPITCCRPVDLQGFCPLTTANSGDCRACEVNGDCNDYEGCCAQPGHQGCCFDKASLQVAKTVTSTVVDVVTTPTRVVSTQTLQTETINIQDENGKEVEVVATVSTNDKGETLTLLTDGKGGYETLDVNPKPEAEEGNGPITTTISGTVYTATKNEEGALVATVTETEDNEEVLYEVTLNAMIKEKEIAMTVTEEGGIATENQFVAEYATRGFVDGVNGFGLKPSFDFTVSAKL